MNMNLFQSGIASIVDANTGYGFTTDYRSTHTAGAERRAREIRSRSIIDTFRAIGAALAGLVTKFRDYRDERRAVARLGHLNDRLLADIGLDRSDLLNIASGATRLDDVLTLRREARDRVTSSRIAGGAAVDASTRKTGLTGAIRKLVAARSERAESRRHLRELLAMDDRQLRDIGLSRGDVIAVEMGQLSLAELDKTRQQRQNAVRLLSVATPTGSSSVDRSEQSELQASKCA